MNKNAVFIAFIFFIWLLLCSYYYLCEIKGHCLFLKNQSGHSEEMDSLKSFGSGFGNYDAKYAWSVKDSDTLVFGDNFNQTMDELALRMSPLDTMLITGIYNEEESQGFNRGFKRAVSIKDKFQMLIDPNRIIIDIRSLNNLPFALGDTFRAADFTILKAGEIQQTEVRQKEGIKSSGGIFLFEPGGVNKKVSDAQIESLRSTVVEIIGDPSKKVLVVGHSSSLTNENANYELGRKRAWAIKKLMWDMGLDPNRIVTDSKGGKEPKGDQSERTELIIYN